MTFASTTRGRERLTGLAKRFTRFLRCATAKLGAEMGKLEREIALYCDRVRAREAMIHHSERGGFIEPDDGGVIKSLKALNARLRSLFTGRPRRNFA